MSTEIEKWRRNEIKRELKLKTGPLWSFTCVPTAPYLIAHACFSCRKSFKVRQRKESAPICPQCSEELHWMGRTFRAPALRNSEQWRKVQSLYAYGFRFFSYRSYPDAPQLPERFREVAAFVAANPTHPFRVAPPNHSLQPTSTPTLSLRRGRG